MFFLLFNFNMEKFDKLLSLLFCVNLLLLFPLFDGGILVKAARTEDGSEAWGYVEVRPSNTLLHFSNLHHFFIFLITLYNMSRSPHVLVVLLKSTQNSRSKQAMAYHSLAAGWTCQFFSLSLFVIWHFLLKLIKILILLFNLQGASGVGIGNFEEVGPLDTFLKPRNTTWLTKADLLFVVRNENDIIHSTSRNSFCSFLDIFVIG